jgi:hypothetical protein
MIRAFVVDVVFALHPDWSQVCAAPYAENIASWRALQKAGFGFMGDRRGQRWAVSPDGDRPPVPVTGSVVRRGTTARRPISTGPAHGPTGLPVDCPSGITRARWRWSAAQVVTERLGHADRLRHALLPTRPAGHAGQRRPSPQSSTMHGIAPPKAKNRLRNRFRGRFPCQSSRQSNPAG